MDLDLQVVRQDRGGLAAPVQATVYEGVAARTHRPGDALRYDTGDEYRDPSELERIVAQLPGKPFMLLHPDGLLRDGAVGHQIGHVVSAHVDGDHAVAKVVVTDPTGQAAINAGTHELSLGYLCKLDSARYQRGTEVDHLALVPRARCGGTCSLRTDTTTDAPGESTCTCRANAVNTTGDMDPVVNEDATLTASQRHAIPAKNFGVPGREALPLEDEGHVRDAMARFGQEQFQGPAERKSAFHRIVARAHELGIDPSGFVKKYGGRLDDEEMNMDDLKKQLDDAKAELAAQTARADQAEKDRDAEKARAEQFEVAAKNASKDLEIEKARADQAEKDRDAAATKAHADAEGAFDARVGEKVALITSVAPLALKDEKDQPLDLVKMTERDIKVAVIKLDGEDVPADKSNDWVNGLFQGSLRRRLDAVTSRVAGRVAIQQMRLDGPAAIAAKAGDTEDASYQSMTASMQRPRTKK